MPFSTTQDPKEQILQAAAELFFERGFAQTGMNTIGEHVGVSGPAIYAHFKGKDEILAALARQGAEAALSRATERYDDPREDLEHLIRNHVDVILGDRAIAGVYVTERLSLAPHLAEPIDAALQGYRARWVGALEALWPGEDHQRLLSAANAAMGLAWGVVLWPEEALQTPGLDDMLVDMTRRTLTVLGDPA